VAFGHPPLALASIKHTSAFPRRVSLGLCKSFRPKRRGRRECRVHAAPAVSRAKLCKETHTSIQVQSEALRHSPRNGFTAYAALSPATNSSCHRHRRIKGFVAPGWADQNLRRLDTSNGCQDHTVLPYAETAV